MPKGERVLAQSKRTAPPPFKIFKMRFSIDILLYFKLICLFHLVYLKDGISKYFQLVSTKTLLKTKRRISFRGSFV
jgi:hypothetical protein